MSNQNNNGQSKKEAEEQTEEKEKNAEDKKLDTTITEDDLASSSQIRDLSGIVRYLFMAIAVIGALYHLYILNFNPIDPWVFRSTHLAFGTVLALMLYKGWKTKSNRVAIIDWVLIAIAIFVAFYIYKNLEQIVFRFGVAPTTMDFIVSFLGLLLVLEITRRAS